MSLFTDEEKRRVNSHYPSLGDRPPGLGTGGLLGLIESMLSSTDTGKGASQVGYADTPGSVVGIDVEQVLDEITTPLTLTVGAEAGETFPVTIAGPAQVAQYQAEILDGDMLLALNAGTLHLSESGAGAEVSTTARPSLLFTTDATGAATILITDNAAGALSGYLRVTPMSVPGGAKAGPPAIVAFGPFTA